MDAYEKRFWTKVLKTTSCWLWAGTVQSNGYGQHYLKGGRAILAHRYSYQLAYGEIPPGMQLHHTCENRKCVNPEHLELLTPRQHMERKSSLYWILEQLNN